MKVRKQKIKPRYSWKQIRQVILDSYKIESHQDGWGVSVIYKEKLLEDVQKRLRKIKQFIT